MGDYFLGGDTSWMDLISQGISVTGAVLTQNPYYGPEDPRYRQPYPSTSQYPTQTRYPTTTYPGGAYPAGGYPSEGAGIRLSNQTLILIGIGVLAFMVGSRRR